MKSKTFVKWVVGLILAGFVAVAMINIVVSPFGLFKGGLFPWHAYSMTQNPRIGKIEYLKATDKTYKNFIVGPSGASSFPSKTLKKYTKKDYYNAFTYGADALDSLNTVKWLVKNYEVEHIILPMSFISAAKYNVGDDSMGDAMHYDVDGTSALKFYKKYLFANPRYSLDKLDAIKKDTYLQQNFDVFNPVDGAYDKFKRDVEHIGEKDAYLAKDEYKNFLDPPGEDIHLKEMDKMMAATKAIVDICKREDVKLTVVLIPMYGREFSRYDTGEIETFYKKLADITDFWDFSNSYISKDPRFFYDGTHFRNDIGNMMLAKIFGDEDTYVPETFGVYVKGDYSEALRRFKADFSTDEAMYTKKLPVLMFHHFDDVGDGYMTMSKENFKRVISDLTDMGYQGISIDAVRNYVEKGTELPEKSVLLTFDDGYESNLAFAYDVLKEKGHAGIVFPIGNLVGKDRYKHTNQPITPHFSVAEAKTKGDVFRYGSHTFDMHQSKTLETNIPVREWAHRLKGESEEEFVNKLKADAKKEIALLDQMNRGDYPLAFSYPGGIYSDLAAVGLKDAGFQASFISKPYTNTLIKGLEQSLFAMGRYTVVDTTTKDELKAVLEGQ